MTGPAAGVISTTSALPSGDSAVATHDAGPSTFNSHASMNRESSICRARRCASSSCAGSIAARPPPVPPPPARAPPPPPPRSPRPKRPTKAPPPPLMSSQTAEPFNTSVRMIAGPPPGRLKSSSRRSLSGSSSLTCSSPSTVVCPAARLKSPRTSSVLMARSFSSPPRARRASARSAAPFDASCAATVAETPAIAAAQRTAHAVAFIALRTSHTRPYGEPVTGR